MTCRDAQHPKHVTYKLTYHFVWCPHISEEDSGGSTYSVGGTGNAPFEAMISPAALRLLQW